MVILQFSKAVLLAPIVSMQYSLHRVNGHLFTLLKRVENEKKKKHSIAKQGERGKMFFSFSYSFFFCILQLNIATSHVTHLWTARNQTRFHSKMTLVNLYKLAHFLWQMFKAGTISNIAKKEKCMLDTCSHICWAKLYLSCGKWVFYFTLHYTRTAAKTTTQKQKFSALKLQCLT